MKKKKLDMTRPQMYYQNGDGTIDPLNGSRIRIFHPNGKTEWMTFKEGLIWDLYVFNMFPCWEKVNNVRTIFNNSKEAFKVAEEYDKNHHFKPMEFLGYL